ncbi:DUF748 domain-containing protein [Nitrospira sp. Nam74]
MSGKRLFFGLGVTIIAAVVAIVLFVLLGVTIFEDELRSYIEGELNDRLGHYEVDIGTLAIRPIALAVDMADVIVRLKDYPDRPVVAIPRAEAKLSGWGLLKGTFSGSLAIDHPAIRVTRSQIRRVIEGVQDKVPSAEEQEMWQDKVLAMFPMILSLALRDAEVTYVERKGKVPLHLTHLNLSAGPIRNMRSEQAQYPTPVKMDAEVNEDGQVTVQGHVDLFAKPHLAGKVELSLQNADLGRLLPVTSRYHGRLYQGRLTTEGTVEYAPWAKVFELRDLRLEKAFINYIYERPAPKPEKQIAKKSAEKAVEVARKPETIIRIEHVTVVDSEFGIVHAGVDPPYRVFFNRLSMEINDFSNRLKDKPAEVTMKGAFMGTGTLEARGMFRPETTVPDFDLSVRLTDVQAKMLNDVLRAHGNIDVVDGELSVYAQFKVQNGGIRGYVKPLIRRLNVYDTDQERGKSVFHKLYEGTLDAATSVLENRRDEAGTIVEVSGEVRQANVDTWQAASNLIKNAFFQVVLPRFERPVRPGGNTAVLGVD